MRKIIYTLSYLSYITLLMPFTVGSAQPPITDGVKYEKIEKLKPVSKTKFRELKPKQKVESPKPTPPKQNTMSHNVVNGCGDNSMANFIYMHESDCNLGAVNSIGCIGIGQSCPGGSGLASDCPNWRTDYACQNRHFTNYANSKYGGWSGAYAFWLQNSWW